MSYIVLFTNPANGRVIALADNNEADDLKAFPNSEVAEEAARANIMATAWDFAVVEAP